jgi:hypothetical protein
MSLLLAVMAAKAVKTVMAGELWRVMVCCCLAEAGELWRVMACCCCLAVWHYSSMCVHLLYAQ